MKTVSLVSFLVFSLSAFGQGISLKDYPFTMTDVLTRGQNRNTLFTSMNHSLIKGGSICSNRAHVWSYDFKRKYGIDSAKIFLFYTEKTGKIGRKTWWYHVAPVIAEAGTAWVMDRTYADTPLTVAQWLYDFTEVKHCQEIRANDLDLIDRMHRERTYPEYTSTYGRSDCYYHITPGGLWTPSLVASHLTGTDASGRPTYVSSEFNMNHVLSACTEAAAGKLGRVFGNPKKKCKEYLGLESLVD